MASLDHTMANASVSARGDELVNSGRLAASTSCSIKCQHEQVRGDGAKNHPTKDEVTVPKLYYQPNKILDSYA